jgi:hypothetical protein
MRINLAGIGQRWLGMERAMGIEPIKSTENLRTDAINQSLTTVQSSCVRFECEKDYLTSQRRPMQRHSHSSSRERPCNMRDFWRSLG